MTNLYTETKQSKTQSLLSIYGHCSIGKKELLFEIRKKKNMPQQQIIGKKGNVYQQAPVSRIKCGGKAVSRVTGSHCASGKSLVQCVDRKLQAPVRSQTGIYHRKCFLPVGRSYGTTTANPRVPVVDTTRTSGTSTCPPTFRVPSVTPRCRKSLSMIDLSPAGIDREIDDLRSDCGSTSLRMGDVVERTMDRPKSALLSSNDQVTNLWMEGSNSAGDFDGQRRDGKDVEKAASLVCHLLAINAWRRRREEVASLQETVEELGQQVDHLHIQIVVLRRLLHTENCRVEKLGNEAHQVKTQLEEALRERDTLRTEKEQLEDQLKHLRGESNEKSVITENLRNELMTLKNQLQALDTQISRDREKLLKLREDKKILFEKVSTMEALAGELGIRAERAEATVEELQGRLNAHEGLIGTLQQDNRKCSRELKETESEKSRLEKRLRVSEDAGRALSLRAANLEMQLSDREAALRRIESAYNTQLNELTEIRERMIRQSREVGWSSRVLQIAGSVVWAPRAILRSLSFLSNSGAQ